MPKPVLTELALADLNEIQDYLYEKSGSRETAGRFVDRILDKISIISKMPGIGILCKTKGIRQPCRIFYFNSYLIVYETKADIVRILRIFHQSVNCPGKV
jgi:plasmid stabilization system protein ParE